MKNIKERQALAERMPWVTRLTGDSIPCDGIKYGTVAVKDLYSWGPGRENPARGIQPRSKCKKWAHWHYKALRSTWGAYAKTGNYCWDHFAQMAEIEGDRVEKYINRYLKEYA